ncbi:thioredoxin family protein [Taibaiella sp. KBW10]|uniref:thioredoxin family protein n=1 Tax=Taibaiella sp. KBW10 TaxID=2153357 RepID=UPI000F5AF0CE|nr:thioredoxin family protein [Taibaiella sp. KBW10]RQO30730.1 thioredoxin family protein [Taibaiella sp. KBW10]
MKSFWFLLLFFIAGLQTRAQNQASKPPAAKVYHPEANAKQELDQAKKKAAKEKKHIIVFIGGNWCPWCMRLDRFMKENDSLHTLLEEYEVVHINYSKENKNEAVLNALQRPQRFGFPVIVILNQKGQQIMTQNTSFLEEGKGYNTEKVAAFLKSWTYNIINK